MAQPDAPLVDAIIEMAQWHGWKAHHDRPLETTRGWRTAFTGDAGFPDLCLAHPVLGVLFAEVKGVKNDPSVGQELWRIALTAAGAWYYLWRPKDWQDGTIERILRDGPGA